MINFRTAPGDALPGRLTYSGADQSFEFIPDGDIAEAAPESQAGTTSLMLDSLQLETAVEDGRILYAWGYSPRASWHNMTLQLPQVVDGACTAQNTGDEFVPGVSERVSKSRWNPEFDPASGVLRVASGMEFSRQVIRIATGVFVGIQDGQLSELWLHPELVE